MNLIQVTLRAVLLRHFAAPPAGTIPPPPPVPSHPKRTAKSVRNSGGPR